MRRTRYSLYVLDRLLALQLGRPVAIHEEDYCVDLPSEAKETTPVFDQEARSSQPWDRPSSLDYFVSVIYFSRILGQVIRDLYRPSQITVDPDRMLLSTTALDEKLMEWKLSLPRHLRFDLGHTFEKSIIFRRQVRVQETNSHIIAHLLNYISEICWPLNSTTCVLLCIARICVWHGCNDTIDL
jgi:Fungal specific transcription factor domain